MDEGKGEQFGPYRLLRKIGLGGINEVFLARKTEGDSSDELVVIKRLTREAATRNELVDLFIEEGRLVHGVIGAHPNIIAVNEIGTIEDKVFLEMEYVKGPDLAQLIERTDELLPSGVAVRVVLDVLEALEHVHTRTDDAGEPAAIVHGDVNPANILVSTDGIAKLTDFGVAFRADERRKEDSQVRGTNAYMSPEQVKALDMDGRSDLFTAAIVLWELLTGERLFRRKAQYLTLAAVVEDDVPKIEAYPALDVVLERALSKDPDDRHASCAELARAIEAAANEIGLDTSREAVQQVVAAATVA